MTFDKVYRVTIKYKKHLINAYHIIYDLKSEDYKIENNLRAIIEWPAYAGPCVCAYAPRRGAYAGTLYDIYLYFFATLLKTINN